MSPQTHQEKRYFLVFAALIALTGLTIGVSFVHFAPALHLVVGLVIATTKAVLVALIFMHLLHSSKMTWLVATGSLFWLVLLIGLTLSDYLTRHWMTY